MDYKLCRGPLHPPGGSLIPLDEYTFNHTGERSGKPLSQCKNCRSMGNSTTVLPEVFMPVIESLLDKKNLKEISKLTNINTQILKDIAEGRRKRIYKKTFFALKRADSLIPKDAKVSIGPVNVKTKSEVNKLSYEERLNLKYLISVAQKERYKKDKKLLRHVV